MLGGWILGEKLNLQWFAGASILLLGMYCLKSGHTTTLDESKDENQD